MSLWLYSLFMGLAQPFLRRKLLRRGVQEPGYLEAIDARFGRYDGTPGLNAEPAGSAALTPLIWIHAVSLGEVRAAAVLLQPLRARLPGMRLLLTHGTATGWAEGRSLLQDGDVQTWQPWDTPACTRRFLVHFKPAIGILMETEVWPNLTAACQKLGVPMVLANARLSEKSLQKAQGLSWLSHPAYARLSAVWAQTQADASRLMALGAPVKGVFGNLKFDAAPDANQLQKGEAWRSSLDKPVVMFASSREGEEIDLLVYLKSLSSKTQAGIDVNASNSVANELTHVQWLIVPRHPQRFDAVAGLIAQQGFEVSRRSSWTDAPPHELGSHSRTIWLGDSLGEMPLYYGMSSVALLGGSFAALGGQNLIEAAACGCPVVMGPHTFNFTQAANLAIQAGAAKRADNLSQGVEMAVAIASRANTRQDMSEAATQFASAHRGAAEQTVQAVLLELGWTGVPSGSAG